MLDYEISTSLLQGGLAKAKINHYKIAFDATSGRDDVLPNPEELLLTSLTTCILKNTERYSEILHIPYRKARVTIHGRRNDTPPMISEINDTLEIDTDADEPKIVTLHKNILKYGTIAYRLEKACKIEGTITKVSIL